MKEHLPDEEVEKLKKVNRLRRRRPKRHKIVHESGRSTKSLWSKIVETSIKLRKK